MLRKNEWRERNKEGWKEEIMRKGRNKLQKKK
jgi:hypothetical protein